MPMILIAVYVYVDQFLLEQLKTTTKKLFLGLFSFSILFAFEYRDRHSHYVPDIILSFIIFFGLLFWLFTLKKDSTITSQTLADIYDHKNNGFNLIRFILATFVFLGHADAVLKINFNLFNILFPRNSAIFAVYSFFVISGFFMAQSLENSKTSKEFLLKRVLRVFPLFFTLVIIGWLFYGQHIQELREQVFLQAFSGVLNIGIFKIGPSWTLKLEFLSYLFLLILYNISNINKTFILIATCSFIALDLMLYLYGTDVLYFTWNNTLMNSLHDGTTNYSFFGLFPCFMIGSLMYLYKDKIICNKHMILCVLLAYLFIILIIGNHNSIAFTMVPLLIIPYLVISCGSLFKIKLWTKYGDYSYGIYLIHYPILFLPMFRIFKNLTIELVFLSFVIIFFAILSWHIIEKQALKLKRYL